MRIKDILTLQKILGPFAKQIKDEICYIFLNTTDCTWLTDLEHELSKINQIHPLLAVSLVVQHVATPARLDFLLFICNSSDVTKEFLMEFEKHVHPEEKNCVKILNFLHAKWETSSASYPLTFYWTTRTDGDFTLIADQAIAPAYQNKGLMKNISLNIIEILMQLYGRNHGLKSFTIHPATYLFFNNHDKDCKSYLEGDLQEDTCFKVLTKHNRAINKEETRAQANVPDTLKFFNSNGLPISIRDKVPASDSVLVSSPTGPEF